MNDSLVIPHQNMAVCCNYFVVFLYLTSILSSFLVTSSSSIVLHVEPSLAVQYIVKGTPFVLNCTANNTANVTLEWRTPTSLRDVNISHSTNSVCLKIAKAAYKDNGIYTCTSKDGSSKILYKRTVEVKVGDLPPVTESLDLHDVCGYPPVEGFISYKIPSTSSPMQYPYKLQLLLQKYKDFTDCTHSLEPTFQLFDQKTVHPSSENKTLSVNISAFIRSNFKTLRCSSEIECTILCATLIASNDFGRSYMAPPEYWNLREQAKCGTVDRLTVLSTTNDSVSLRWSTPKCLAKTTKWRISFKIIISCGFRNWDMVIFEKLKTFNQTWTRNVSDLQPYKRFTFSVFCAFGSVFKGRKAVTVEAWTKEGVPTDCPTRIIQIKWLNHSSVFVQWEAVTDDSILQGKLRSYVLTYRMLNDLNATSKEKPLGADVQQTVVLNLKMGNYSFTIKACTSSGCCVPNRRDQYHLLGLGDVRSTPLTHAKRQQSTSKNILLVLSLAFIVIIIIVIVYCVLQARNNGNYEMNMNLNDLDITTTVGEDRSNQISRESIQSNIYVVANIGFSSSSLSTASTSSR